MSPSHASDFMGTEPVHRLLRRFALPAMVSSLVNCLYNIVDRLYLGHAVGPDAIAGLALTMPYMIVLAAFGMMIGQGSGAMVSLMLGEKRPEDANRVLGQAIAMYILFIFTFQTLGLIFLDQTLRFMGTTGAALPHARSYLRIILWGNIFQHLSFGGSNIVRAEGDSMAAMGVIVLGAVMNIILDPIFIFVFGMGIRGAAVATILAMAISSSWVMFHFIRGKAVQLHLRNVRLHWHLFWRVVSIGLAPCVMQCLNSVIFVFYNRGFLQYAENETQATLYIAAFGIVNPILMALLMPAFGINMGAQPIIGYNTGAKLYHRVEKTLKLTQTLGTVICFGLAVVCFLLARPVVSLFCGSEDLIQVATHGLRVAVLGLSFIGVGIITSTYYQSTGRATISILVGCLRQGVVLIPTLVMLPMLWGLNAIWWAGPFSDALAGVLCWCLLFHEIRRLRRLQRETVAVA
ncbi:MAG: MATE family efflux transporter [Oligosphaeraceae bacterium]